MMATQQHKTIFSIDCGATNWRLYRMEYLISGSLVKIIGEPQPTPLTSFVDRRLPAVICMDRAGKSLESYGEVAQQLLEDERQRERVREHFKPCIGSHLEDSPLPHQKRYTHAQALVYTRLLLEAVIDEIRREKLRSGNFDERINFTFAYPVHWRIEHSAQVFEDFSQIVRDCFPDDFEGIRFVAEPEGAILALKHRGLLAQHRGAEVTLIVDVGGSTTDIVAGRIGAPAGRLEFLGRYGGPFGGDLYDVELAKWFADELNIPPSAMAEDPSALISLRLSAQRLKESLSRQLSNSKQVMHVPQRMITLVMQDGSIYRKVISLEKARFLEIVAELDQSFTRLVDDAIKTMAVQEADIGQVVLVGGGAQLFSMISYLKQRFGSDKVILADNPEEIVVQGLGLEFGASFQKIEPTIQFPGVITEQDAQNGHEPEATESIWKLDVEQKVICLPIGITTIGRGEKNDYQIDDLKASRIHARLHVSGEKLELTDLSSTNGTFVNGVRLEPDQPRRLAAGDEIYIGKTRFVAHK